MKMISSASKICVMLTFYIDVTKEFTKKQIRKRV